LDLGSWYWGGKGKRISYQPLKKGQNFSYCPGCCQPHGKSCSPTAGSIRFLEMDQRICQVTNDEALQDNAITIDEV